MLDNTIDASGFPLEEQRQEAMAKRRIGVGLTGLADALMMVGERFGSAEAAEVGTVGDPFTTRTGTALQQRGRPDAGAVSAGRLP